MAAMSGTLATTAASATTSGPSSAASAGGGATRQPGLLIDSQGLRLPPVILGISALGNLYRSLPSTTKAAIVAAFRAHTAGVALFDGAGKYGAGLALEELGLALREGCVGSEQVAISNKLGWRRAPLTAAEPTFEPGVWKDLRHDAVQDISYEGILRCWAEGERLLGAPYRSALVSVHDPDEFLAAARGDPAERAQRVAQLQSAYRALEDLRRRGAVAAVGLGAKDWRVARELAERVRLDWVMIACSLTVRTHPAELRTWVARMAERGVRVINSAIFHGGFLTGGDFYDYQRVDPASDGGRALLAWREAFTAVCRRHGATPAHAAVRFANRMPGVASLALGTSDPERVATLVRMAVTPVPESLWPDLAEAGLIERALELRP